MEKDVTMMTQSTQPQAKLYMRHIEQIDNHNFQITWSDNTVVSYRLSDLQRKCPCAHCVDESTGKRRMLPSAVDENVTALKISNVGRYGLKIIFTSGCSTGIYSYQMLLPQKSIKPVPQEIFLER